MQVTAPLTLRFLGEPQVLRDGCVQPFPPSKKTRALLAYLALQQKPFRRDTLCELLWEVPDDPKGSLRWSLSKLRRLVDDENRSRIIADRLQVGFDCGDTCIDVFELQTLIKRDLSTLDIAKLKKACEYFSGRFLEGLDFPNFPEFYLWCIAEREKITQHQAQILSALIDRLEGKAAIPYARDLIKLVPAEQNYHVNLIRLLNQNNRAEDARQQLELSKQMLADTGQRDLSGLMLALRGERQAPQATSNQASNNSAMASEAEIRPAPHAHVSVEDALAYSRRKIIGRDEEVKKLVIAFKDCIDENSAKVILLRGDSGMGKSCLLQTATRLAQKFNGWVLHADTFESEIIRPFALWNDAYRRSSQQSVPAALDGDENSSRDKIFAGLSEAIGKQAALKPVIIIFDDVQWSDESSAAALHYVVRMNRHKPVFCVIAARDQELGQNQAMLQALSGLRGDQLLQEIKVGPLSEPSLHQIIHNLYPSANAEKLSEECCGNPLLAIELARAENEGNQSHSLKELMQERLSRLDKTTVDVLQWAAVLEPHLELKTLKRVTNLSLEELQRSIDIGEQQSILLASPQGLHFSHALIARSIYDQLTRAKRQIMHRRAAEVLEVETALDLQLAAELTHHAEKSGDPAMAARALIAAGRLCMRFFANNEAKSLAEKGLAFAAQLDDADRVCLTLELSEIKWVSVPVTDWRQAADESVMLAESALDHGALPYARLGYQLASYLRWLHGDWKDAQRNSLQAERITRGGSEADQILGMGESAKCLALLEKDLAQAEALAMEANSLAKRKQIHSPVTAMALGILRYYTNDLYSAEEYLEEARTGYKASGDRFNEFIAIEHMVMIEIERRDFAAAQRRCLVLFHIGENLKDSSEYPFCRAVDALCQYALTGDDSGLDEPIVNLRLCDAKHRLAYILIRAAFIDLERVDLGKSRIDAAVTKSTEALEYAKLLYRPTEQMLAHLILALAHKHKQNTADYDQHLAAIQELDKQPVAKWARQRATQSLTEFE